MSDIMNRLLEKVKLDEESGCWMWQGAGDKNGYGCMSVNRRRGKAHRWMYEAVFGEFDKSLFVCHRCDTPACVNPFHLFLGTALDNNRDCSRKGRKIAARGDAHPMRLRPELRPRGIKNGMAKLTRCDVIEIRERYADGMTQDALARMYNVRQSCISRVIHGKRWTHV